MKRLALLTFGALIAFQTPAAATDFMFWSYTEWGDPPEDPVWAEVIGLTDFGQELYRYRNPFRFGSDTPAIIDYMAWDYDRGVMWVWVQQGFGIRKMNPFTGEVFPETFHHEGGSGGIAYHDGWLWHTSSHSYPSLTQIWRIHPDTGEMLHVPLQSTWAGFGTGGMVMGEGNTMYLFLPSVGETGVVAQYNYVGGTEAPFSLVSERFLPESIPLDFRERWSICFREGVFYFGGYNGILTVDPETLEPVGYAYDGNLLLGIKCLGISPPFDPTRAERSTWSSLKALYR